MVSPRPHILNTKPYKPGGKLEASSGPPIMLASNEAPFGPSPKAIAAMQAAVAGVHVYPDPKYTALRDTIRRVKGLDDIERILLGSGSDELINLLIQAYAGPWDEVLYSEFGFSMYPTYTLSHGATPVAARETDLETDVDAMLAAVTSSTKLCFVANPNNPTGSCLPVSELRRLRAGLPEDVLLIVDGAYLECTSVAFEAETQEFAVSTPGVAMIRTYSKLPGLAALRLGWGYFPTDVANYIQRIRSPFNINAMAVAAGIAAMEDQAFISDSRDYVIKAREELTRKLETMGLEVNPSNANFVLVKFKSPEAAAGAAAFLRSQNILVRETASYGLPDRLRITIGAPDDLSKLVEALGQHLS